VRRANRFVTDELGKRGSEPLWRAVWSQQLADQLLAEKQVDEIHLPHFKNTVEECLGQRVESICNDHR
jgi:hypothetical protein